MNWWGKTTPWKLWRLTTRLWEKLTQTPFYPIKKTEIAPYSITKHKHQNTTKKICGKLYIEIAKDLHSQITYPKTSIGKMPKANRSIEQPAELVSTIKYISIHADQTGPFASIGKLCQKNPTLLPDFSIYTSKNN